jgi:hypothetical protein
MVLSEGDSGGASRFYPIFHPLQEEASVKVKPGEEEKQMHLSVGVRSCLVLLSSIVLASLIVLACPREVSSQTTDPFVRVEGTRFTLGGVDYKPVGFNQGNLAGSAFYACGAENNPVDHAGRVDHLRRMKAMNADVVRFFAFQAFATRNGVRDWSAMDSVMRAADEVGIKVMPALGDHWEWCAPESRKDGAWYGGGYKVKNPDSRHATSYEQYVREFATRYAQEDAIAFVSLMNEPRGPFNELYAFCRDVSAIYKQYDSNHPLTCGVGGNNEQGSVNDEYERMHAIPTIDFADYHDYSQDVFNGSPLVPQVSLSTRLYAQAANWQWGNGAGIRNSARVWQKVSYTVPSNHPNPLQRLGLQLTGAFAGTIYVDDVVVGGTTYRFGSGVQNFRGQGAVTSVAHTSAFGRNGTGALKATKDSRNDGFVYRPSTGSAGVSVSAWVYVDDPGSLTTNNSLAGTVRKANEVFRKPHMVGEAGLQCGPSYRTASSRASLFDQRIAAHRNAGGDAYLAWVWHPTKSCNNTYDVTSGDPLSSVLGKY